jgi:hypothetical protein
MGMDPSKRPTTTPNTMTAPTPGPSEANKSTQVELTILIAMPQPPQPPTSGPSRIPSMTNIHLDTNEEQFGFGDLPHYQHTSTKAEEEEEEIPYMELGTTVVPVTIRTEAEEDTVMGMRLGSRAGMVSDWSRGGAR